jgi:N-acetylneuraminic acid mutarotase
MPTRRVYLSTSVVNDKIYAIGGSPGFNAVTSVVEEYVPWNDKWTKKADMLTARSGLSTSVVDGKIYAIGGWKPGAQPDGIQLSTVEEYDPATDTWTTKTDMSIKRTGLATCAVNGRIYAIGGGGEGVTVFSTVEVYDPLTDTWTKKADMPTGRVFLSASVANGKIYAIGGMNANGAFSTVEEYTPEAQAVSPQGNVATTWGKIKSD